jgi:hypothetical protein
MADEPNQDETATRVFYRPPNDEYRFATGVVVKAGKLVYLDFAQHGASDEREALGIARIVMHPELADDLLRKLSDVLKPE